MELHQLSIVRAIAETGGFSRAADRVHLTQPAVSTQVRLLEEELGCRLFLRGKRGASLTVEGEAVLRAIRGIDTEIEGLKDELDEIAGLNRGHLCVACSDTFATYFLPTLISKYASRYPGIDVSIYNGTSSEIRARLLNHTADIGFVAGSSIHQAIETTELMEYDDVAVVAPDHPFAQKSVVSPAALSGETLLLLEEGTSSRTNVDELLAMAGVVARRIIDLGSVAVQQEYAAAGIGVAVVPGYAAHRNVETGRLARVEIEETTSRRICLAYAGARQLSRAAAAFVDLCGSIP